MNKETLTIEIPKGYKTLDTREFSEGDRHWIEVDLIKESEMCPIRQPHDGIDCPCNEAHGNITFTSAPIAPDLSDLKITHYKTHNDLKNADKPELPEELDGEYLGEGMTMVVDTKVKTINQIIRYLKAKEKLEDKAEKIKKGAKKFAKDFEAVMKDLSKE